MTFFLSLYNLISPFWLNLIFAIIEGRTFNASDNSFLDPRDTTSMPTSSRSLMPLDWTAVIVSKLCWAFHHWTSQKFPRSKFDFKDEHIHE